MIPQMQTDFTFTTDDCMRACVASILEVPLARIPNFMKDGPDMYYENIRPWFLTHTNLIPLDIKFEDTGQDVVCLPDCVCVAVGKSPRAKKDGDNHAVVWFNGEMIHDPHPDGRGLDGYPISFTVFVKRDIKFEIIHERRI